MENNGGYYYENSNLNIQNDLYLENRSNLNIQNDLYLENTSNTFNHYYNNQGLNVTGMNDPTLSYNSSFDHLNHVNSVLPQNVNLQFRNPMYPPTQFHANNPVLRPVYQNSSNTFQSTSLNYHDYYPMSYRPPYVPPLRPNIVSTTFQADFASAYPNTFSTSQIGDPIDTTYLTSHSRKSIDTPMLVNRNEFEKFQTPNQFLQSTTLNNQNCDFNNNNMSSLNMNVIHKSTSQTNTNESTQIKKKAIITYQSPNSQENSNRLQPQQQMMSNYNFNTTPFGNQDKYNIPTNKPPLINKPANPTEFLNKLENSLNPTQISNIASDNRQNSNRHNRTEAEKDKELLREVEAPPIDGLYRFGKSPWYVEGGEMRDYQVRGLNWMIQLYHSNRNGILADEMGLGKTLQTISMLGYLKHCVNIESPKFLVITPKSTLQNWMNEIKKWVPSLIGKCLIGTQQEREVIIHECNNGKWDVLVSTYEIVIKERIFFKKFQYSYLAIDEAHRIKNEKSKLSEVVREMKSENRLLITGTPLQNNLHELWALLNFLMPQLFDSAESFDELFNKESLEEQSLVLRLHNILKPFLLRRLKIEVEKKLLPKKEIKVYIGLTKMQRELYTKILMKDIEYLNTNVRHAERNRLQNILMQLRKCTNHPYLFDGIEPGPPYTTDYHLVGNCGKMVLLDKLLKKLKEGGNRVLLFTQMTSMLDILEDYCQWIGYEYCRLDGQTAHSCRQESIDQFNAPNSTKFLFMLSTRAGGLGINLTTADTVILYDSDWNPQVDLQAQDRAHRIGQTRQVNVYRLITEHTVEEKIIARADMKLRLDSVVIQQQGRNLQTIGSNKKLEKGDMLSMIRHGANFIFKSSKDGGDIPDEDIDALLTRGQEKTDELQKQLDELEKKALNNADSCTEGKLLLSFDTLDENDTMNSSVYNFEGENYKKKICSNVPSNSLVSQQPFFIQPPKRERKSNVFYESLLPSVKPKTTKRPKPPKHPVLLDFQFYPKRLYYILEKEVLIFQKQLDYKIPINDGESKETKAEISRQQEKINKATPLTKRELADREKLLKQGFSDWTKRDLIAFVRANEKFGRENIDEIVINVPGKSSKQVKAYGKAFWKNYKQIKEHERYLRQIHNGDLKRDLNMERVKAISVKLSMYKNPLYDMKFAYTASQGITRYSETDDRFLIYALHKLGGPEAPNVYERLQDVVRKAPNFRLNWFMKSRNANDLQKRCYILINLIHKELVELNNSMKGYRKKMETEETIKDTDHTSEINMNKLNLKTESLVEEEFDIFIEEDCDKGIDKLNLKTESFEDELDTFIEEDYDKENNNPEMVKVKQELMEINNFECKKECV